VAVLAAMALVALMAGLACRPAERGTPGGSSPAGTPVPPEAQAGADAALREASGRLGLPRDQLAVIRIEPREWSDTSLGCPQPGQMYAQVITPGYLIIVSGRGRQLEYHTDTRGRVVLCR
jgi:hypothetical protein